MKNSALELFANSLANDIAKRYPPELDSQPGKRPSANRLTRIIEDSCQKAIHFKTEQKLSWFGQAKLGNKFKWALKDLGYQPDFVDFATEAIIINLSKKLPSDPVKNQ